MKTARICLLILVVLALLGAGCAGPTSQVRPEPAKEMHTAQARPDPPSDTHTTQVRPDPPAEIQAPQRTIYGVASWYGKEHQGRRTASGERFNMYDYTAAHRSLPFGTKVRVTNLRNNRQVVVRINDRGPFVRGREIDLSYAAARDLGILEAGLEKVRLDVL